MLYYAPSWKGGNRRSNLTRLRFGELRINGSRVTWKEDVSDVKGVWKICGAVWKIDSELRINEYVFLIKFYKNWRILLRFLSLRIAS